jgi:intraflagellar transport protein 56
MATISKIE